MSRLLVTASLVLALTAPTLAGGFAQPPPGDPPRDAVAAPSHAPVLAPSVDRAEIRARLAAQRAANLARFRAYRTKGTYPSNVYAPGQLNVWRDQQGRFCAAATIIRASGHVALVDRIAAADNFIRLADVEDGPLLDWILTSGLTQAELVLIQRPFRPVTMRPEPRPETLVAIDDTLRAREDARLARLYRQIEARLSAQGAASLDAATDRLLQHPAVARAFLATAS